MTSHAPPKPRGARISPDRPFVGAGVIILVLIVMLAAMAFSFIALYEAAEWTHNPREFWWLAPVIIDGPILVYTASYAIWRWRTIDVYASHAMRVLIFFTSLSVLVNSLHVASGWEWTWTNPELYGGIAMAAVAPIGALLAAHEVTRLVFMNHDEGDTFEGDTDTGADTVAVDDQSEKSAEDEDYLTPKLDELFARKPAWADDLVAAVQASAPEPEPASEPDPEPRPTTSLLAPQEVAA